MRWCKIQQATISFLFYGMALTICSGFNLFSKPASIMIADTTGGIAFEKLQYPHWGMREDAYPSKLSSSALP
eukprot:958690-Ditylum_brightwellii.AAC.1